MVGLVGFMFRNFDGCVGHDYYQCRFTVHSRKFAFFPDFISLGSQRLYVDLWRFSFAWRPIGRSLWSRKLFLTGIGLFTLASLGSGIATNQIMLIVSRAAQGLGAAVISAVGLSLVMRLFTESSERAKAMGVFGFVAAGGGSLGVLLGGVLTGTFNWHWIFLVNLPIGILVLGLCLGLLPKDQTHEGQRHLDVFGSITITTSLLLAVYAIINGNEAGWTSFQTLGLLLIAAVLFAIFLMIESRVKSPLMPLSLFRLRNIVVANIAGILWSAGMFAWFFLSALYLQIILHYTPWLFFLYGFPQKW